MCTRIQLEENSQKENCCKCLYNFDIVKLSSTVPPLMLPKKSSFWRWDNGHEGEWTNNVFCYSSTLQQSVVATIWGVLGCWLHGRWEPSCAFPRGDICQNPGLFLATGWHAPCISRGFLASLNNDLFVAEYLAVLSILMSGLQPILRFDRLFSSKNCGCKPQNRVLHSVICLGRVHG